MTRKCLFLLSASVCSAPLAAQEAELPAGATGEVIIADMRIDDSQITVLANASEQSLASTGDSVTVFDRDDMDEVQGGDLTRLLERAPGVSITRNGGPGNFTGVRVRGAEGEQLLVLIDGVRVADTASPGGGFDFANLLMGNLAKVELQRSSNSTIWGSQALGGVLAATTGSEPGLFGSAEYGAHDTFYGAAGGAFDLGPASFGLQAGHFDSDGFSAAAAGTEPDGFRQIEVAGRVRVDLAAGLGAFGSARYADGRVEIDSFLFTDSAEHQDTRQLSGAAGLDYASDALDLRAALSLADTERENFDPAFGPAPGFTSDGESERAELRGRWRAVEGLALDFGVEREWLRFSTLFDAERRTAITGAYAQLDYDAGPVHLAAGLRRDDHRDFGGEWSLGADAAYELAPAWRVRASFGEGFKAPTLFQLHSDFGNGLLQPERSRSYDLGIEFTGNDARIKLTAFHRDTDNLIVFIGCPTNTGICENRPFGTYDNIGRARAQGLELDGELALANTLSLGAAITLLEAEDRTPGSANRGNDLPRRPEQALTARVEWTPLERLALGADLRAVSSSFDDADNAVRLGGYEVLTLRASYDLGQHVTLFGRIENVWDETYQTAAGYATPGRGAHIGARARL